MPALYWQFDSKTDICYAFLEKTLTAFNEALLGEFDDGTPVERLRRFVRNYVRVQVAFRDWSTAFEKLYTFGQLSTVLDDEQRERLNEDERRVVARLRLSDGRKAGVFAVRDVKLRRLRSPARVNTRFSGTGRTGNCQPMRSRRSTRT